MRPMSPTTTRSSETTTGNSAWQKEATRQSTPRIHNQRYDDGDKMAECLQLQDLCDLAVPAAIMSELMDLEVVVGTAKTL